MNFAETVVMGGVAVALAVNLAVPYTVRKPEPTGRSCMVEVVEVVHSHHFDVGSLSRGVQWAQVGPIRLPVIF